MDTSERLIQTEARVAPVTASGDIEVQCVDCDVHPALRNPEELVQYMPARWRRRPAMNFGQATIRSVYVPPNTGRRLDSFPPGGGRPGSDIPTSPGAGFRDTITTAVLRAR